MAKQCLVVMAALAVIVGLAGCTGTGGGMRTASAPVSTVATESIGRARAKAHTELAFQYFQEGNMAVALEEIAISINADASYPTVYSVRGLVQMYLKENEAAEASFRKALQLAPADPEINNNYGWFLCQIGRERESFPYFMTAVKNTLYLTPERSLVNAGQCAAKLNDLTGAEEFFQKALAMGKNSQSVYVPMAQLQYRKGDLIEAQHYLAEFHRRGSPTAESLWLAVRVERKLNNRSAEADFVNQLRRRFPESRETRELRRGNFE